MEDITFANPKILYLLILLAPYAAWYIFRIKNADATLQVSTIKIFEESKPALRPYLRHALFILRTLVVALLIVALARPQSINRWEDVTTEGIDIMLSLDISGSMLARDFQPNRLEAAKDVAIQFISGRPDDRMGLVVFSGESFTQCPLTSDHAVLINLFKDVKSGIIEDGTAIGLGLATAVNRLKDSKAVSKVIILLTDGVNNRGDVPPLTAAEIAKSFGIRVYTVGVGSRGVAPYPVQTPFGTRFQDMEVQIDEEMLEQIALFTDGRYFRATNKKGLEEIYREIDNLEKSKIDVKQYSRKKEEYLWLVAFAAFFLAIEVLLRNTAFKTIP